MCKKKTNTAAGAICSAMGRETISKSRVSPKNVKSRGNFGLICLSVCFAFSTTAFADDIVMQSAKSKIIITVGTINAENLLINWGDGKTSGISDGVQLKERPQNYQIKDFAHSYTDGKAHTITLSNSNTAYFDCQSNELTLLNVSNCPNLKWLYCDENQLTDLKIKQCPNLYQLNCQKNRLKQLDVSDVNSLEVLDCYENQLTNLNIGNQVSILRCYKNQLTDLHIQRRSMGGLACGENRLRSLTFTKPCTIGALDCSNNQLTNLDISNMRIDALNCSYNKLTNLDASMTDGLRELNIDGCSNLQELICDADKVIISSKGCYNLSTTAPVPEGTVTVKMSNSSRKGGNVTVVTPEGFSEGFYIDDDNFRGKKYTFKTVGKVTGIADINSRNIPRVAWSETVAVKPGYGYVARKVETTKLTNENGYSVSVKFMTIYVVSELLSAESTNRDGVIGAEVQYLVVPYNYD